MMKVIKKSWDYKIYFNTTTTISKAYFFSKEESLFQFYQRYSKKLNNYFGIVYIITTRYTENDFNYK